MSTQDHLATISGGARTVTGANLQGSVKVVKLNAVRTAIDTAVAQAVALEAAKAKSQEESLRAQIADLEARLAGAAAARAQAIDDARAELQKRIAQLEASLPKDDPRPRILSLENEVNRLRSELERWQTAAEVVTAVTRVPTHSVQQLVDTVVSKGGPFTDRTQYLGGRISELDATVVRLISAPLSPQGVVDLVASTVAAEHVRQELVTIASIVATPNASGA